MNIVVYVRSDVDWTHLNEDNFMRQEGTAPGVSKEYLEKFLVGIKLWNQLYDMSFFEYRRGLRDIAAMNLDRMINLDAVVRDFSVLQRMDWTSKPTWVIPVDDDDWFHPELTYILDAHDPNEHQYAMWPIIRLIPTQGADDTEPEVSPQKPLTGDYSFPLTNMYAVSNSGIKAVPGMERQRVLTHHGCSHGAIMGAHRGKAEIVEVTQTMAITYKSPASFTQVTWPKTLDQMEAFINTGACSFERHARQLPQWAWPSAERAGKLLNELIESRKSS